ncbi:MAG: universal stress protein, partial [Alphaproteobacteria bacterium]|nr:universal stress protein [Alphaproteobacteria bacterium]
MIAGGPRRRRVLVALDAGPGSRESLRRAAELADEMGAELSALFVEDANLFRLAGLPAAEIALGSGARRPFETRTLERELRARAAEARAELEEIARARQLAWSFQVWRGQMREALK